MKKHILTLMCLLLVLYQAFSQNADPDTDFLEESLASAREVFQQNMGNQSQIFNGREYIEYDRGISGHPFYLEETYEYGELEYNGNIYDSVPMKYDIHKDILVIKYYNESGFQKNLVLNTHRINGFFLHGHRFITIPDTSIVQPLTSGIYELLFRDEVYLLSKRAKKFVEEFNGPYLKQEFEDDDAYYLIDAHGQVFTVKNQKSILKAFPDQKKDLRKYIKSRYLDFRVDYESSIISTLEYISTLKD